VLAAIVLVGGVIAIYYAAVLLLTGQSIFPLPFPINANPSISANSQQWSGYVVRSSVLAPQAEVTSVSGSWVVPSIQATVNDTYAGTWIGIGGFGENTLIQTGTLQQSTNGRVQYYAWYELIPALSIRIPRFPVSPGDTISASINLVAGTENSWVIEVEDVTQGNTFSKTVEYNSSRLSAEWIVERPNVNNQVSTLSDFGNITFLGCSATIGTRTSAISDFPRYKLDMYTSSNVQLTSVSALTPGGSGFTISYQRGQTITDQASFAGGFIAMLTLDFVVISCYSSSHALRLTKSFFQHKQHFSNIGW
jgi:hypothetical protein